MSRVEWGLLGLYVLGAATLGAVAPGLLVVYLLPIWLPLLGVVTLSVFNTVLKVFL